MQFSYGLIPKQADNDKFSLANKYVEHFESFESLQAADARFTQGMKDANLGKGPLWAGCSVTGVQGGTQDIAVVRQAIDVALGQLLAKAK